MIQTHTIIDGFSSINLAEDVVTSSTSDRIVTIGPIGKDYTSIALALAGEADFQTGEDNIIFEIDAGVYSSPIAFDTGFTTSSTHRVIFRNASGAFHNYTRGEGVRVIGTADWGALFATATQYVDIIGIACHNTSTVRGHNFAINAANCRWINCFSYDRTATTDSRGFIGLNGNPIAVNCASVNCGVGFENINSDGARWYNCVALNCATYGFYDDSWGPAYWTNCYSGGSGTADYYKPHSTSYITTSFSEDGTLSTSTITIANCGFTNSTAGSEDVSISSSSDFIGVGTDLSGDSTYPFDTDGFGTARDTNWDIGVMEYAAPGLTGSVSVSQKKQTISASGWSGPKIVTIDPSGDGDYLTLPAAITGELSANANLVTLGRCLTFLIQGTWSSADTSTTIVSLNGFTTSADYFITITTDSANRAGTSWSTSKYRFESRYPGTILDLVPNYTILDGVQVHATHVSGTGVLMTGAYCKVLNSYIRSSFRGLTHTGGNGVVVNSIIIGAARGIYQRNGAILSVYYSNAICTGAGYGIQAWTGGRVLTCKNSYFHGGTGSIYDEGGATITMTNCATSDGLYSTTDVDYTTSNFANVTAGSEDFDPPAGSGVLEIGTDLSEDVVYPVTTDILNTTRSLLNPCVGVVEKHFSVEGTINSSQKKQTTSITGTSEQTDGMVHIYVDTDAGTNGDGSIGSPYNSFANAWISDNYPTTRLSNVVIHLTGDTATTTSTLLATAQTSASYHLYLEGERTLPYWDTNAHRFVVTGANCFEVGGYVHFNKLQIQVTPTASQNIAIFITGNGKTWISNSILRGVSSGYTYCSAIEFMPSSFSESNECFVWNNIIYDFAGNTGNCGIWCHENGYVHAYNNTIYNCYHGLSYLYCPTSNMFLAANNIISNCDTNVFLNTLTFALGSTNNTSTDGTRPDADSTNLINQTVTFVDESGRDLRLDTSSTNCIDNALDLSENPHVAFNTDAVGISRPQNSVWDRGAFELHDASSNSTLAISQKKQSTAISGTSEFVLAVNGSIAAAQKKQSTSISGTSVKTATIIDHTHVDLYESIPQDYIDIIITKWFNIPGESHSYNYRRGLQFVEDLDSKFAVSVVESGTPEGSTTEHLRASRATWGNIDSATGWVYGYGEEDYFTSDLARTRTKAHLQYCHDNSLEIGYMGFGWCWDMLRHIAGSADPVYMCRWAGSSVGGPEGDRIWGLDAADTSITSNSVCMDTYLSTTKEYIDYCTDNNISAKIFYTTGPVDSYTGEAAYQREVKHEYIRNYITTNGGYLFDYADILCWNNAGVRTTANWTDGESTVHTFSQIAADNLLNFDGSDGSASPYHIGERGELRVGKAVWVMLAMMEGWNGISSNATIYYRYLL